MQFSRAASELKAPPRVVVLSPDAFEDSWAKKPTVEAAIGLRRLSQQAIDDARRDAELDAVGFYERHGEAVKPDPETFTEVYNDTFLCNALAQATVDPNDANTLYFGDAAADTIRLAVTSAGLRRLWTEYTILEIGTGILRPEASDDDLETLATILATDDGKSSAKAEVRRLLKHCLEQIGAGTFIAGHGPFVETDDESGSSGEAEDAGGVAEYILRGAPRVP
jgi:hypothetical protein